MPIHAVHTRLQIALALFAVASAGCANHQPTNTAVTPSYSASTPGEAHPWPEQPDVPESLEVHLMGAEEAATAPADWVVLTPEDGEITDKALYIKISGRYPYRTLNHEGWTEAEIEMLHRELLAHGHELLCCEPVDSRPQ
jgi:hypothetical protein